MNIAKAYPSVTSPCSRERIVLFYEGETHGVRSMSLPGEVVVVAVSIKENGSGTDTLFSCHKSIRLARNAISPESKIPTYLGRVLVDVFTVDRSGLPADFPAASGKAIAKRNRKLGRNMLDAPLELRVPNASAARKRTPSMDAHKLLAFPVNAEFAGTCGECRSGTSVGQGVWFVPNGDRGAKIFCSRTCAAGKYRESGTEIRFTSNRVTPARARRAAKTKTLEPVEYYWDDTRGVGTVKLIGRWHAFEGIAHVDSSGWQRTKTKTPAIRRVLKQTPVAATSLFPELDVLTQPPAVVVQPPKVVVVQPLVRKPRPAQKFGDPVGPQEPAPATEPTSPVKTRSGRRTPAEALARRLEMLLEDVFDLPVGIVVGSADGERVTVSIERLTESEAKGLLVKLQSV